MIFATTLLALVVSTSPLPDNMLSADSMMVDLKKGGYTILWRHPATDYSKMDEPGFPNTERFQQRNLYDKGVRDARAIGEIFKPKGIPVGDVIASPMFRTREAGQYAFGRVTVDPLLIGLKPTPEQVALLAAAPAPGMNRVLITHHFIIEQNVPGIKPGDVGEGEAVVIRTVQGKIELVSIFKMADWMRIHDATVGPTPPAAAPGAPGAPGNFGTPDPNAPPAPLTYTPLVIPALLSAKPNSVVADYLQAFNTARPAVMRKFFETSAIANPAVPVEKRLDTYNQLVRQLGTLTIESVEQTEANKVTVKTHGSNAKSAVFNFTIEPVSPFRIAGIGISIGAPQ
jgi:hypothetical protein